MKELLSKTAVVVFLLLLLFAVSRLIPPKHYWRTTSPGESMLPLSEDDRYTIEHTAELEQIYLKSLSDDEGAGRDLQEYEARKKAFFAEQAAKKPK